jgi:hypothetical protein
MKLIDGIKLKGRPAEIPNCSRDDLPELFKELGFKVGVEIGVFEGNFTEVLGKSGLKVYGVDPWLVYEDYGHPDYASVAEKRYQKSLRRLAPYPNVTILREMSQDALKRFENESIDFVYIDGNHQFKYIAEDLYDWWKKVKKGGIICGHDYAYFKSRSPCGGCQVREVVDAYAKSFNIDFWVIGNKKRKNPTDVRDDYRSWFFIKGNERDPKNE